MIERLSAIAVVAVIGACAAAPDLRLRQAGGAPRIQAQALAAPAHSFRLATFNAGLAVGFLPYSNERAPQVVEALAREPADLWCVQEFWLESHWRDLTAALAPSMPFATRPEPEAARGNACTEAQTKLATECVRTHCGNEPQADLAACAVQNCRHLAGQLLGSCLGCLSRDPLRDVDTILNECGYDAARAGAGDADGYFYGGSYGIGLLTNAKVLAQSFLRVRSTQHPRGIIHVELDTPVADGLHVFCTHLTPELGNLARPKLGSWREEQAEQVRAMLAFIEAETEPGDAVVVMGDLNTGPAIGSGVGARLAGHYERFIGAGFTNPYTSEPHASCTFCYDNPVSGGGVGGSLLDHVLIRDMPGIVSARRILDAPIHVESHGRDVETALSDHYGLLLVVQRD